MFSKILRPVLSTCMQLINIQRFLKSRCVASPDRSGGGERLAYCVAFGLFLYIATLTQFSGKVGFVWLGRFGVVCASHEVRAEERGHDRKL